MNIKIRKMRVCLPFLFVFANPQDTAASRNGDVRENVSNTPEVPAPEASPEDFAPAIIVPK
jgi:hypothetical protein